MYFIEAFGFLILTAKWAIIYTERPLPTRVRIKETSFKQNVKKKSRENGFICLLTYIFHVSLD